MNFINRDVWHCLLGQLNYCGHPHSMRLVEKLVSYLCVSHFNAAFQSEKHPSQRLKNDEYRGWYRTEWFSSKTTACTRPWEGALSQRNTTSLPVSCIEQLARNELKCFDRYPPSRISWRRRSCTLETANITDMFEHDLALSWHTVRSPAADLPKFR